ncbi:MAG: hypothetical protein J6Q22_09635 [Prevotella sp.]|nr:hypothetical protein [Prevotella sp.]
MNKRQINSIKKVIAHTRNAIAQGRGYYMPSNPQTEALKALFAWTYCALGKRDLARFAQYLMSIDSANLNEVYAVCADEKLLQAIEEALSIATLV